MREGAPEALRVHQRPELPEARAHRGQVLLGDDAGAGDRLPEDERGRDREGEDPGRREPSERSSAPSPFRVRGRRERPYGFPAGRHGRDVYRSLACATSPARGPGRARRHRRRGPTRAAREGRRARRARAGARRAPGSGRASRGSSSRASRRCAR